jgi:hypothetical protein
MTLDLQEAPAAAARPSILKQILGERLMSHPIPSNLIQKASNRRSFLKKGVAASEEATRASTAECACLEKLCSRTGP